MPEMSEGRLAALLRAASSDPPQHLLTRTTELLLTELTRRGATMTDSDLTTTDRPGALRGPLSLLEVRVASVERAASFFGAVFGWTTAERAGDAPSRVVTNTRLPIVLHERADTRPLRLGLVVDDVGTASRLVGELGGDTAACVDNEGRGLVLLGSAEFRRDDTAATPTGDFGFVFLGGDVAKAREFYGRLLGWEFVAAFPGKSSYHDIRDGEELVDGLGFSDGAEAWAAAVLDVTDGDAASALIVEFGGDAGEEMGYGAGAIGRTCHDDQGTAFTIRYPGGFSPAT